MTWQNLKENVNYSKLQNSQNLFFSKVQKPIKPSFARMCLPSLYLRGIYGIGISIIFIFFRNSFAVISASISKPSEDRSIDFRIFKTVFSSL